MDFSANNLSKAGVLGTLLLSFFFWTASVQALDLIEAVREQDSAAVRSLIAEGSDPNIAQADGATALHWAVHRENAELVALLLEAGADINATNRMGASPLFIAARSGHTELIEQLLVAGANPNLQLTMGETPLMSAARAGSALGVSLLIEEGADVNVQEASREQSALMWAASQGHVEVARVLIEAGADVNAISKVRPMLMFVDATNGGAFDKGQMENLGGFTPLLFAARNGHTDLARELLSAGADIDLAAGNGTSPLVIAAHSGHGDLAIMLLEEGANPDAAAAGYNALHAAILRGDIAVVDALLAHGADPDARVERATPVQRASEDWVLKTPTVGATSYWLAASFREAEIMKLLADNGADPMRTNLEQYRRHRERAQRENPPPPEVIGGFVSTLQAAIRGDSTRQRYYVQANPDPVGEERKALESAIVALDHGVNIDHTDFTDSTALHDAATRNLATVVRELAERGANLNALNGRGQTALDLAIAAERRLGMGILAQETPEYVGPTARQILEGLGALESGELSN